MKRRVKSMPRRQQRAVFAKIRGKRVKVYIMSKKRYLHLIEKYPHLAPEIRKQRLTAEEIRESHALARRLKKHKNKIDEPYALAIHIVKRKRK